MPLHWTGMAVFSVIAGRGRTLLTGATESMVLRHSFEGSMPFEGSLSSTWSVAIWGWPSKEMSATFVIWAPVVTPALGLMV